MYKLLDYYSVYSDNPIKVPKQFPNDFEYLNSKLFYNINDIITSNYFYISYIKKPNMFISLLNDINLIMEEDVFDFYEDLVDSYIYYSNNYGITNTKNKGKPHENIILNNVNEFVLLEETSSINLIDFENKWRNYESIRVIATDNTELIFNHLYGVNLYYTNFIVYKLDLIGLALQYFYWKKEQINKEQDVDIALFLYQVPFNNIIKSFTEMSLANLFLTYKDKSDIITTYSKLNSELINIDHFINKVAVEWNKLFKKEKNNSYYRFTKKFYPFTRSLYEVNKIITIIDNENEWLYLLSVLNELSYYIDYIIKDKEFISDLKITLKTFKRKNIRLDDLSKFYLFNLISVIEQKTK